MRETIPITYWNFASLEAIVSTYPHLQDSMNKLPVRGLCNTNATPTRLDEQVAGVRDYATPMSHLQDSIHKSLVWGTMQHTYDTRTRLDEQVASVRDYAALHKTLYTSRRCRELCNTNATPTRLDEQVAGVGDYATPMPHLQDLINKSPVWGTMQHQCHTYKTL